MRSLALLLTSCIKLVLAEPFDRHTYQTTELVIACSSVLIACRFLAPDQTRLLSLLRQTTSLPMASASWSSGACRLACATITRCNADSVSRRVQCKRTPRARWNGRSEIPGVLATSRRAGQPTGSSQLMHKVNAIGENGCIDPVTAATAKCFWTRYQIPAETSVTHCA